MRSFARSVNYVMMDGWVIVCIHIIICERCVLQVMRKRRRDHVVCLTRMLFSVRSDLSLARFIELSIYLCQYIFIVRGSVCVCV